MYGVCRLLQDILDSKFRSDEENKNELRASEKKTKKLMRNLKEVQSTIADVETKRLLKKYDEEVYKQINENLRSEIESACRRRERILKQSDNVKELLGNHDPAWSEQRIWSGKSPQVFKEVERLSQL